MRTAFFKSPFERSSVRPDKRRRAFKLLAVIGAAYYIILKMRKSNNKKNF